MRTGWIVGCVLVGGAALALQASAASPFATAMSAVCRQANAKVAAIGVSQSLYELDANEPRLLAANKWKLAKLLALGKAPVALTTPFARYLTLQRKIDSLDAQMVTAAKKVHLSAVEQLQPKASTAEKAQNAPARKIGALACVST
jgi:hypothetical protein